MQPDAKTLQELVRRILTAVQPDCILLFGSAARGTMGPDSDLDVLVVVNDGSHRRHLLREIYSRLIGFPLATDVVVATRSDLAQHSHNPALVFQQALAEGRELYHAAA